MPAADMVNVRIRDGVAYVGPETTFGTEAGTLTQVYPIWDQFELDLVQDELENLELRSDLYDAQDPVKGNKHGELKMSAYLRPDGTQLVASGTATRPWLGHLLYYALGAEFPATTASINAGTTIASAASATSFTVTSAASLSKGMLIGAQVTGAIEVSRIINISGTTITVNPAFSATPSVAGLIVPYCYAPARSFSTSFSARFAHASGAGNQWSARGCMAKSLEFDLALGQMPKLTLGAEVSDWTGPSALGYTATAGTNPMGSPFVMRDAYLVLQAAATTTRAHLPFESAQLKVDLGTEYVPDPGGVNGRGGVTRIGGRDFATLTLQMRPDMVSNALVPDATWWTSRTPLQALLMVAVGTGTTKRWLAIDLPTCVVVGKPKRVSLDGRLGYEITLRSKRSAVVTSATEADDFQMCPFQIALV